MESFNPYWLLPALVPVLIVASLLINLRRARRWEQKARDHGSVHCRSCNFVGVPVVGTLASDDPRSANLRLICSSCKSPDWYVPDSEQSD
ncbi:MAG: hypothetical protein HY293_20585 [Planctomycetes bacterium]|nr:hypothetical protein [Planctomycetota bacterium]